MNENIIEVFLEENGKFKNARVNLGIMGIQEINTEEELKTFISNAANLRHISEAEFKRIFVKEVNDDKKDVSDKDDDIINKASTSRSKKKHKGIKRLVTTTAIIALLTTGGFSVYNSIIHNNEYDGHNINFQPSQPTIESQSSENSVDNNEYDEHNINFQPSQPTIESQSSENSVDNDYYDEMRNITGRQRETFDVIGDVAQGGVAEHTYDEYMQALNDLSMISNCNMLEISNFINGDSIKGTAYYSSVESSFYAQADYEVVKWFNEYRNSVVYSAYDNHDSDVTISTIRSLYTAFTEFVLMDKPYAFTVNGQNVDVHYSQLSPMAQASILNICGAMLTINCDYSYQSNQGTFIKDDLSDSVEVLYNNSLESIDSNGFNR